MGPACIEYRKLACLAVAACACWRLANYKLQEKQSVQWFGGSTKIYMLMNLKIADQIQVEILQAMALRAAPRPTLALIFHALTPKSRSLAMPMAYAGPSRTSPSLVLLIYLLLTAHSTPNGKKKKNTLVNKISGCLFAAAKIAKSKYSLENSILTAWLHRTSADT